METRILIFSQYLDAGEDTDLVFIYSGEGVEQRAARYAERKNLDIKRGSFRRENGDVVPAIMFLSKSRDCEDVSKFSGKILEFRRMQQIESEHRFVSCVRCGIWTCTWINKNGLEYCLRCA